MLNTRVTVYGSAAKVPVLALDTDGSVVGVSEADIAQETSHAGIPVWQKYSVTIALVDEAKHWFVNGEDAGAMEDDATDQTIVLASLAARSFVSHSRIKTVTPGTGVDSIAIDTFSGAMALATDYDGAAAASATNLEDTPAAGGETAAAHDLTANIAITGAGKFVDDIADLAFDVWALVGVLP